MIRFFKYRAVDKNHNIISDMQCCRDVLELKRFISNSGLTLIKFRNVLFLKNAISKIELLEFFRYIHIAISNKIDFLSSLQLFSNSTNNRFLSAIVKNIIHQIKSGNSIEESFLIYECIFGRIVIKMIEIAERTATLEQSCLYIYDYLKIRIDLNKMIKNMLRYPIILLAVIIAVLIFWCFAIVPVFVDCFNDMGIQLTSVTQIIMGIRQFFLDHNFVIVLLLLLIFTYIAFSLFLPQFKRYRIRIFSRIPFIKNIRLNFRKLDFFKSMHVLISGGISIPESIVISSSIATDSEVHRGVISMVKNISSGISFSSAMRMSGVFSDHELSIIDIADKTNSLGFAFKILTDMTKFRIQEGIKYAMSIGQPIIVIFGGLVLLGVIYSVISPLYDNISV